MKKIIWIVVILLILLTIVGFSKNSSEVSGETIKIGAIYAMTGPAAKFGELSIQGVRDAVEYFKETTNNLAEVVIEDSASDPKQGVSAASKIFNIDKIKFVVIGTSAVSAAVAPVAENAKGVLISDAALLGLTKDKKYTFQNFMPSLANIPAQINEYKDWKNVAILYINDEFGNVWQQNIKTNLDEQKSVQGFSFEKTATDYRTEATKIKQFQPDVMIVIGYGPALNQVLADLTLIKVSAPIIGYLSCTLPGVLADERFSLEGQYSYEYPAINNESIKSWMKARGRDGNTFYTVAFENTLIALDAAKQNGENSDKAVSYLKTNNFSGLWSNVTFNNDGVVNRDLVITKIQNGTCVPINQ